MRSKTGLALAFMASLSLAACGTTPGDRAVSGGLLGAGTGALIGSIAGSAGQGALIGGVGGALLGAVTSPGDLYMGEPPWHHSRAHYHHRHHHASNCKTTHTSDATTTVCRRK